MSPFDTLYTDPAHDPEALRAAAMADARRRGLITSDEPSSGYTESEGAPTVEWADPEEERRAAAQAAAQGGMHMGTAVDTDAEGALGLYSLIGAKSPVRIQNRDYEGTRRYVGTMRGALGRASEAQTAIDESGKALNYTAVQAADAQADAEEQLYVRRQTRLFEQEELANRTLERQRRNLGLAEKGAERMMNAPGIDPNRWWASRTAGQRAMATISLIARGLGGRDLATSPIFAAIDRDIEAQRANFAQLGAATTAAQNNTNLASQLYHDIRGRVQDDREADEIYRLAKLQSLKAHFDALAARVGLPGAQAQIDKARAEFDMAVAEQTRKVDHIAAHNVRSKVVMRPSMQAHRLADGRVVYVPIGGTGAVKAADFLAKRSQATQAGAYDIAKSAMETQGKLRVEAAKAGGGSGLTPGESRTIASDDVQGLVSSIKAVDRYLTAYATDVPNQSEWDVGGRGFTLNPFTTHDEAQERADRAHITAVLKNQLLGKTMTELEVKGVLAMMPSDSDSGDMRRERMRTIKQVLQDKLSVVGAALGPEGQRRLQGTVPRARVDNQRMDEVGGSLEEDAAALEGTPE